MEITPLPRACSVGNLKEILIFIHEIMNNRPERYLLHQNQLSLLKPEASGFLKCLFLYLEGYSASKISNFA